MKFVQLSLTAALVAGLPSSTVAQRQGDIAKRFGAATHGLTDTRSLQDMSFSMMEGGEDYLMGAKSGKGGKAAKMCFQDKTELMSAISAYSEQDCANDHHCAVGMAYGWPMNTWCTSHVTDMSFLFDHNVDFNEDINGWDVSNVQYMYFMFASAISFNGDLSAWDTSNVSMFWRMFRGAYAFNTDVNTWDVTQAVDPFAGFFNMFGGAKAFNTDLSGWDISNAQGIMGLFYHADNFNQDISGWNTSKVLWARGTFAETRAFNQDLSSWDMSANLDGAHMFEGATAFNQDMCAWQSAVNYNFIKDIFHFSGCTYTQDPNPAVGGPFCAAMCDPLPPGPTYPKAFDDSNELRAAIESYIDQNCAHYDGCATGAMYGWPMNSWDTSKLTNLAHMFEPMYYPTFSFHPGLFSFNEDINGWDVSSVTYTFRTFRDANMFNSELNGWNTSSLKNPSFMFAHTYEFNQDISGWDVSNVETAEGVFNAMLVFNQDVSGWNLASVTNPHGFFYHAEAFNQDINGWNLSGGGDFGAVFYGAYAFNQDISSWDLSNAYVSAYMFEHAQSFNQDLCEWGTRPFPYVATHDIFADTSCETEADPAGPSGPFCHVCVDSEGGL